MTSRVLQYASVLREYGLNCRVINPIDWQSIAKGKIGNIFSLVLSHHLKEYVSAVCDPPSVFIIAKISTPQIHLLQKILRKKGADIIFDLDDAMFLPNSKFLGGNIRSGSFSLEKIISDADHITVNGHFLLEFARQFNNNVTVLHDPVDTELFCPRNETYHDRITIGWEGIPWNHYKNLSILLGPLGSLARDNDIRFKIVSFLGDLRTRQLFKRLENSVEIDYGLDHLVPMNELPALISDFDIMVAPLQSSAWYEGKSALRVGMGMAMGIPVVASPVGEQRYVVRHGYNGFLAKDEDEFYLYLRKLIEDGKLRRELGQKGRETAERELSLTVNGRILCKIIKDLRHKQGLI